jgi:hypothetical protein
VAERLGRPMLGVAHAAILGFGGAGAPSPRPLQVRSPARLAGSTPGRDGRPTLAPRLP